MARTSALVTISELGYINWMFRRIGNSALTTKKPLSGSTYDLEPSWLCQNKAGKVKIQINHTILSQSSLTAFHAIAPILA